MVTTLTSVFNVANPSPGKCFIVGRTPFDSSPEANASARVAVVDASNEKVRPSLYMNELVEAGNVGDRRQVDVNAEVMEGDSGARALRSGHRGTPGLAHLGRRDRRRCPRDPLDRPALLVDGDQERRLAAGHRGAVELLRQRHEGIRGRDVRAEEDDPADFAPADAPEQVGAWCSALHADHQLLADQLAERR